MRKLSEAIETMTQGGLFMYKYIPLSLVRLTCVIFLVGCAGTQANRTSTPARQPALASVNARLSAEAATSARVRTSDDGPTSPPSQFRLAGGNLGVELENPALTGTEAEVERSPNQTGATTAEGKPMSLADLEAWALQNNPTLSQAAAGVDSERGVYRQAGLYPNPQVGYVNSSATPSGTRQSNGAFFSQEFVTADKLTLAQQSSAQDIKRLQWDQEAQRLRVVNDLTTRFYEVLAAQRAVDVAAHLEKIAGESLSTAEELFSAKSVTRADVLQAKMLLETSRITLDEATHRHEAAWEQLTTITGALSLRPMPLVGDLEAEIPDLDLEACWQRLLAESPQLRATESELDHGWAEVRVSEAQAIPNFTVQTIAERDSVDQSTTVSTLVAVPVPFFNRNQGNIAKSMADVRADQDEICRVQLVLRDQLADSFRRYKTGRGQAERLRASVLPYAEENLKLALQAYKSGEVSFREVLSARKIYAETQMAYIEATTEARKAVIEIDGLQLSGGLNPAAIGSAIQSQPGGSTQRQRALLKEAQDRASKQLLPAAQLQQ